MLGTPPAFILSQDRTLSLKFVWSSQETLGFFNRYYCLRSFLKISWTCNNSGQRIFCSGLRRNACIPKEAWLKIHWMNPISEKTEGFRAWTELLLKGRQPPRSLPYRPLFLEFSGFYIVFSSQCSLLFSQATALIYYHKFNRLSTTFLNFFFSRKSKFWNSLDNITQPSRKVNCFF